MAKVICQNCGAEVVIPQKTTVTTGLVIGEDADGTYVVPTKTEGKEMREVNNTTATVNNTTEGTKMDFTMEELTKLVAATVMQSLAVSQTPQVKAPEVAPTQVATEFPTVVSDNPWAKNSKYYGKEICGFVFNPYMFRYHIVKEYRKLCKEYRNNIHRGICENYDNSYAIRYVVKEIEKMALLERKDLIAYEERKHTFTFNECKQIIIDYYTALENEIKRLINIDVKNKKLGSVYIKSVGRVGEIKETIYNHKIIAEFIANDDYNKLLKEIQEIKSELKWLHNTYKKEDGFQKLNNFVIKNVKFYEVIKYSKLSNSFKNAFIRSGAYYTMKAMITFEGYSYKGTTGRDALIKLRQDLEEEKDGYIYHKDFKDMIER